MRNQFRIIILYKFYPCRTAGSKLWQYATGGNALYQLCRFFGNGQVSGEVDIHSVIETGFFHRSSQLAFYPGTCRQAKFFAQPYTSSWAWLCYYHIVWVVDGSQYFVHLIAGANRTGWTPQRALSTMYTNKVIKHRQLIIAEYALYFFAGFNTLTTQNTFFIITHDRRVIRCKGYTTAYRWFEIALVTILIWQPACPRWVAYRTAAC